MQGSVSASRKSFYQPSVELRLFVGIEYCVCALCTLTITTTVITIIPMLRSLSSCAVLRRGMPLSSQRFAGSIRAISSVNRAQYPSPREDELVNDEYYEVVGNGLGSELEEAVQESSPVPFRWDE